MKRLSPLAALMIVNAYCAILLRLVLWAIDPATDWTPGFIGLMLFFCLATAPVFRLAGWLALGSRSRRPHRRISRQAEA